MRFDCLSMLCTLSSRSVRDLQSRIRIVSLLFAYIYAMRDDMKMLQQPAKLWGRHRERTLLCKLKESLLCASRDLRSSPRPSSSRASLVRFLHFSSAAVAAHFIYIIAHVLLIWDNNISTAHCSLRQQRSVEGERERKKKLLKIFRNGMRKRPKKVVSARNCFPFKVDHKTYVDKLSWVSAAMLNVVLCAQLFMLFGTATGYWLCVYCLKFEQSWKREKKF